MVPHRSQLVQVRVEQADTGSDAQGGIPAGEFSDWLRDTEAALRSGKSGAEVPCGSCRGCCRSSMFIHIHPEEVETIRRIPRNLPFPAPGFPQGHVFMGYDDQGRCPMLIDNACSIYEHRPQTCRDYDCRIFAATAVPIDEHSQPEIAERVNRWRFSYRTKKSAARRTTLLKAAAFLQRKSNLFPRGSLPDQPGPLAEIAVRIHPLFTEDSSRTENATMVDAILTALDPAPGNNRKKPKEQQ